MMICFFLCLETSDVQITHVFAMFTSHTLWTQFCCLKRKTNINVYSKGKNIIQLKKYYTMYIDTSNRSRILNGHSIFHIQQTKLKTKAWIWFYSIQIHNTICFIMFKAILITFTVNVDWIHVLYFLNLHRCLLLRVCALIDRVPEYLRAQ